MSNRFPFVGSRTLTVYWRVWVLLCAVVVGWPGRCGAADGRGEATAVGDVRVSAGKGWEWEEQGRRVLHLERDVVIDLGSRRFEAESARVRVEPVGGGRGNGARLVMDLRGARGRRGDGGAVLAEADRLGVTVVVGGEVRVAVDSMREGEPPGAEWLAAGEKGGSGVEGRDGQDRGAEAAGLLPVRGTVGFHADKVVVNRQDDDGYVVLLSGRVQVGLRLPGGEGGVTLTAERGVLFADGGEVGEDGSVGAGAITGVYLEDNVVATDGSYTVRAPRVYYEVGTGRAVVLDAVLYTWDVRRGIPIYVRAEVLRQRSRSSWAAEGALLTTSEFAVPHLAIGADRVEVERGVDPQGEDLYRFAAEGTSVRVGGAPVFVWPKIGGEMGAAHGLPLRRGEVGFNRRDGAVFGSTWDLFALGGQAAPRGVDLTGQLDYLGEHGGAVGLDMSYDQPRMNGSLRAYYLPHDSAEDEIGNRNDVKFDGEARGRTLWRHRQYVRDRWELSLELGHVTDETFLEEFFEEEAYLGKPYEASLYLKKQQDEQAFTFLVRYDLQDFTAQLPTLLSTGYTVDQVPELGYYSIGSAVFDGRGTYYGETRVSRVRLRVGEDEPEDRGFKPRQSRLLFGIPETTNFDDVARAAGVPTDYRLRFDTRHELQVPLTAGDVDLVPYVVGRATLYDDDFESFSGEDDAERLWGAVGLRVGTQVSRVYEDVRDRVLDLHRLRHVVEPSADVFLMGTTLDSEDLPVYDEGVENLGEGFGVRLGVRNTWQTQRGGEGRWRSVDWLTLKTDVVLRSDDVDTGTEIARFFSYRPEYSRGGDHVHADLRWLASETLAVVGEVTSNLEEDNVAQWRVGATLRHSDRLVSFLDYVDIDPMGSRLLHQGWRYRLTRKYDVELSHTVDLVADLTRRLELVIERKLPRWRMRVVASHDDVDDEQSIGVALIPEGIGGAGGR